MPEIICLGEALIDMVASEVGDLVHATGFEKAPGGAPANVAAGAGILGADVGFIGKVGDDPWGECLRETLRDCNVDVSRMVTTKEEYTRLAFVSFQEGGGHDFLFHGVRGADELLEPDEQRLFRRLGAFTAGFTLQAAEAIAGTSNLDVFEGVDALLTKSLLYELDGLDFEEGIERAAHVNSEARMTDACRAGVRQFLERSAAAPPADPPDS